GVYFLSGGLAEKRLGLIRELLPRADLVGLLLNPNNPLTEAITTEVRATASAVGQRIEVLHAGNGREIEAVFAALTQKRASAFVLSPDPLFFTRRVQLVTHTPCPSTRRRGRGRQAVRSRGTVGPRSSARSSMSRVPSHALRGHGGCA